ncbi:predicted protein [Verticillium alfalfae VaMs.102]|uniref:Predicted protein n=1 Tax=Verticillium alfalfae (strain VaMs.102 / ATCC MYA-4576 / FGSC 10136) TaxID=526221 RepID=C9SDD0_VERA1|nr:predicted protein [Verticillium alfalfae VaMs.102]EEY17082.1 predicted protein [Verticillium alfalfae VaMs.102]
MDKRYSGVEDVCLESSSSYKPHPPKPAVKCRNLGRILGQGFQSQRTVHLHNGTWKPDENRHLADHITAASTAGSSFTNSHELNLTYCLILHIVATSGSSKEINAGHRLIPRTILYISPQASYDSIHSCPMSGFSEEAVCLSMYSGNSVLSAPVG